jgi:UDP-hydrolysing UDP-N-acetyl-D-glucosamine 2-epimerase
MSLRVGVVTVGRSDYGIYYPVLRVLHSDEAFELKLIVAAAHLLPKYGYTVREIEEDGFPIAARVPVTTGSDAQEDVAMSIGLGVQNFTMAYQQVRPDILVLLGDRYEMFAAATAALPLNIPIAHIHGGELTLGAIDDAIRHAITKLSHIHFAATADYGRRIQQMGEEPWRIHVTGSPAIDSIRSLDAIPRGELEAEIGLDLSRSLLITYHPVTLEENQAGQVSDLLMALSTADHSLLFTYPNADSCNSEIIRQVSDFVETRSNARLIPNLGHRRYHSLQRHVAAMVGNSSSGIVEAASFHLPVVNIGTRQMGRIRAANVIDVAACRESIEQGIARAVSVEFRNSISTITNPYGDGRAAEKIVSVLRSIELGKELLMKKFVDYRIANGKPA